MSDTRFPYEGLPDAAAWATSIGAGRRDVQGSARFRLTRDTALASAGSCFAIRLAERLRAYGMNYLTAEAGPPRLSPALQADYGYRPLSARYGNIYTFSQLAQLLERARGAFDPKLEAWRASDGTYVDPFRPHVQPTGFDSLRELEADRENHLAAVLRMFSQLDVFVFTVGITEAWRDRESGAIVPRPPGRGIGAFDAARYELVELDVADNVAAFDTFAAALAAINPSARVILTVSPVHAVATITHPHVGRASTYTKAVLRVAVEQIARTSPAVDYFASYEIVTLPGAPANAYLTDCRSVSDEAVADVMRSFFKHYYEIGIEDLHELSGRFDPTRVRPCDEAQTLLGSALER